MDPEHWSEGFRNAPSDRVFEKMYFSFFSLFLSHFNKTSFLAGGSVFERNIRLAGWGEQRHHGRQSQDSQTPAETVYINLGPPY
jgi:hypothetical protein